MRPQQEQLVGSLCHLFNAVPVWGLLFCGWIWMTMREESRTVVYHARQAMMFHSLLMVVLVAWIMLEMLAKVLNVLSPLLGGLFHHVNTALVCGVLGIYVIICLLGFLRSRAGQAFHYPLIKINR